MAEDKEILISIKVDNEAAQKSITEQTKNITDLQDANKRLKKTQKDLSKQTKDTSKERAKLGELVAKNNLKISEANKIRRNSLTILKQEVNSLGAVKANLRKAGLARDEVNLSTKEGQARYAELTQEINNYNTTLKDAEAQGNSFKRNVGNYTNGIKDAAAGMVGFGQSTDGASGAVDALGKVVKLNPIGILVSLLVAMVAAFGQTEEGAKKLKIIMAVLSSVVKDFVSLLAEGGALIVDLFVNPLENIKAFGNSIKTYVIDQFALVLDGLGTLGDAISALFSGDFDKAAELAGKGFNTLYVEANPLFQVIDKGADIVKNYTEKVIENAEETVKLTQINYDLQRSMLATQKQVVALQGQEAVLAKRSEDATLSFQEQEEAQKDLMKVQGQRFSLQQSLLSKEEAAIQSELNLARSRNEQTLEIEQRLTAKQIELTTNRNEQRLEEANNLQITAQRNQDIWEQELDFIIDVGEKRRTRFEEIATDESNSLAKRTEGLNAYDANLKQFLQSQKESFVEEGLTEEEFDRLLGIQDPAKLAEAITAQETLSEIEKNRLREVFIEFENAEIEKANVHKEYQDIITEQEKTSASDREKVAKDSAKKEEAIQKQVATAKGGFINSVFELAKAAGAKDEKVQKALATAQIIKNTAVGISKALTLPFPVSIIQASAVGASGAAGLINIANSSSGGGSVQTPTTPTTSSTPIADTSQADNALSQQSALEDAISNLGLTVSVTEINDAQNNVQLSEANSTI